MHATGDACHTSKRDSNDILVTPSPKQVQPRLCSRLRFATLACVVDDLWGRRTMAHDDMNLCYETYEYSRPIYAV
jgi:hypothetical protein